MELFVGVPMAIKMIQRALHNEFSFGWIISEDGTRWINSILDWHKDIQKEVLENLVSF